MARARTHYRTCNLCEAMCGLKIELEGQRVVQIRGDEQDPFSRGHICPKALGLQDLHEDDDRVRTPLRRRADGSFEAVGWDEALDAVADRLHAIQRDHGRNAVATYLGNPNAHNFGSLIFGPALLRTLRSRSRFSATSVDQLPAMLASFTMYGHQLMLPVPDIERTRELIIVGANPLASNGSIMSAGDVRGKLKAIQAAGGRIAVLDPRRTQTAKLADEHDFIRPGTDALAMLAMLREGLERHGPRLRHLEGHVEGLDRLREVLIPFAPGTVARHTGLSAARMNALVDRLWGEAPAVVYGRVGACVQRFGGLTMWAVNLLNLLSGNFDRPGGAMFTRPAVDLVDAPPGFGVGKGGFARWRSRVRGLPEFGSELPAAVMAEEMETEGEGQIRALLTIAGNPVLSTPNGRRLDDALAGLDFMVSIDMYVNATTRHADYILPPTSQLERSHYDLIFNAFATRNVAKWSPAAIDPPPGARHDWQILQGLNRRILARRGAPAPVRAREALLERLGPDRLLDLALRLGQQGSMNPLAKGLSLRRLKAAPHGLDLGPLQPCMPARLPAHQPRIQLAPEVYLEDLARLGETLGAEADVAVGGFQLINRRDLRSNNSWMHNVESLVKGPDRCRLEMHPDDAQPLGIADGQRVLVRSDAGSVEVRARFSEDLMPGVVCMPHGWGHGRKGVQMRVAEAHAGVSVNDLTSELQVDELSGVAVLTGQRVQIEAAAPGAT